MAAWYDDPSNKEIIDKIASEQNIHKSEVIHAIGSMFEVTDAAMRNNYDFAMLPKFGKFLKRGSPVREVKNKKD